MTPERHWLLTWATYGNRVPGAAAGFVGNVRDDDGEHVVHNVPGTPVDADMPGLERYVRERMKGPPVALTGPQAGALIVQYQETARVRGWKLEATSVMYNHTHLVVGVPGDPDPEAMLELFKSWATRALKKLGPVPPNGGWWAVNGSKRKLRELGAAVVYVVRKQPSPLEVWYSPEWQPVLDAWDQSEERRRYEASRSA